MRTAVATLLLIIAPFSAGGNSLSISKVTIANPGIYELKIGKTVGDSNLAGSSRYVVTGVRRLRSTTSIPARMCTSFGFEYVISGRPHNAEVPIKMVMKFPTPGLRNPETQQTTYGHETVVNRTIGRVHFRSYTLEEAWELVPGVWTFELWYQDRKLAEQSFTLTAPCADCGSSEAPPVSCQQRLISEAPQRTVAGGLIGIAKAASRQ